MSSHRTAAKKPRRIPQTLRLASIIPSFNVEDVATTLAWYRNVLGFHVQEEWKKDDTVVGALLLAGSASLIIRQDEVSTSPRPREGAVFVFRCTTRQNLDEIAAEIQSRGGVLATEPTDQPGGVREFGIIDPNGYRLTFSSNASSQG